VLDSQCIQLGDPVSQLVLIGYFKGDVIQACAAGTEPIAGTVTVSAERDEKAAVGMQQ
jgi:hypothetical protein